MFLNGEGNFWFFSSFFMIIWLILLVFFIIALVRWFGKGNMTREDDTKKKAEEILKERYAKGEIDKNEFEGKKKDIK